MTRRITYLEDGDWAILTTRRCHHPRRGRASGQPRRAPVQPVRRHDRQGRPPPLHGQGDLRTAAGHRRCPVGRLQPHRTHHHPARSAVRSGRRAPDHHDRLRHRLAGRAGRQVLDRAIRRRRRGLGRGQRVPLSPPGAARRRPGGVHQPVRRDRRHARRAALLQGARPAYPVAGQRAGKHHRARKRCRVANPGRAGNRRRLDQGLHHPACRPGLPDHRFGAGARRHGPRDRGPPVPGPDRGPQPRRRGAEPRRAHSRHRAKHLHAGARRALSWVAGRASRWPWKARSS